jgi:hypothetical protein
VMTVKEWRCLSCGTTTGCSDDTREAKSPYEFAREIGDWLISPPIDETTILQLSVCLEKWSRQKRETAEDDTRELREPKSLCNCDSHKLAPLYHRPSCPQAIPSQRQETAAPAHEHNWSSGTSKCACGAVNASIEAGSNTREEALRLAREFIESKLTPPFLHGDANHKTWLANETRKWIAELAETVDTWAASRERRYREALRTAKIRLEICLGRMRACKSDPASGSLPHEVSLVEIPAWIEEMSGILGNQL